MELLQTKSGSYWLLLEPARVYVQSLEKQVISSKYLCYVKNTKPTGKRQGSLLKDKNNSPVLVKNLTEAEQKFNEYLLKNK